MPCGAPFTTDLGVVGPQGDGRDVGCWLQFRLVGDRGAHHLMETMHTERPSDVPRWLTPYERESQMIKRAGDWWALTKEG
jgi:hypothetical protein